MKWRGHQQRDEGVRNIDGSGEDISSTVSGEGISSTGEGISSTDEVARASAALMKW